MSRLVLKNLNKQFNEKIIIHDLNLTIETGEFVVIVGPSGCGKSTLLRLIAGLDKLTSGEIILNDALITHEDPKNRNIAMVFQNYALYPHMTVYNNMAYGLRVQKINKQQIADRVNDIANKLAIADLLHRKPHQLSGGQRQRVAMGRALVRKPAFYLFDEPLSNLDAKLRVQMRLEIKKMHQEFNVTSIYVTHDQTEAMTLADRLVVINQGRVEQIGSPMDVYLNPASIFVAGFIGSPAMNFLQAKISHNGHLVIDNDTIIPIKFPSHYCGHSITVGIRPENLFAAKNNDVIQIHFNMEMLEALGSDTLVHGYIGTSRQAFTARFPGQWLAEKKSHLALSLDIKSLHFFDSKTGRRIEGIW